MLILYLIFYVISYLFSQTGHYLLSGFVLIVSAFGMYGHFYIKSRRLLDLRGLLCLSWIGGQGIACLKLSHLAADWQLMTWICFLAFPLCFIGGYNLIAKVRSQPDGTVHGDSKETQTDSRRLLLSSAVILCLSVAGFILEAAVLGFIPLFSSEPHAYSYFHLSGVHYFTVSAVLVPALSVAYLCKKPSFSRRELFLWLGMDLLAFLIPVLCVSRFQLIVAVVLALFVYMMLAKHWKAWYILVALAALAALYVGLTFARRHDVEYLNGIFEMKNEHMPIFVTQPYIYIANNYDNFNCLVEQLPEHTWGLRMCFPLFALTGLKFLRPELVSFPIYITKTELTTVGIIYDAYYDFGIAGVIGFGLLLGAGCALLTRFTHRHKNPASYLFYAQIALYLLLSFFTTWFSNPTTWFWLALTAAVWFACGKRGGGRKSI